MSGCGKIPFETRAAANTWARKPVRKQSGGPHAGPLHPYRCPRCGKWHLTHLSKDEQRRIERRRRHAA